MEWQTIETAPKDGMQVLGFGECDETLSCIFIMAWDDVINWWVECSIECEIDNVTHWMPLPALPDA
jgi:hypothetical protein